LGVWDGPLIGDSTYPNNNYARTAYLEGVVILRKTIYTKKINGDILRIDFKKVYDIVRQYSLATQFMHKRISTTIRANSIVNPTVGYKPSAMSSIVNLELTSTIVSYKIVLLYQCMTHPSLSKRA
jgi:hypothetical protein